MTELQSLSAHDLGELGIASLSTGNAVVRERVATAVGVERARRMRAWLQRHLVDPYATSSDTNAKWDTPATCALSAAADYSGRARDANGDSKSDAWDNAIVAANTGCMEGHLNFVLAHWVESFSNKADAQKPGGRDMFIQRWGIAADQLKRNKGLPLLHARALAGYVHQSLRSAGQILMGGDGTLTPQDVQKLKSAMKGAIDDLSQPLPDRDDALPLVMEWWRAVAKAAGRLEHDTKTGIAQVDAALQKAGVSEGERDLFLGSFQNEWADELRGTGTADTVNAKRQKVIDGHWTKAADLLEQAWRLDPTLPGTAPAMLAVELGQGQGGDRMELWFARGRAVDASDFSLYDGKLFYLLPRYYGTIEEARAFGVWCLSQGEVNSQIPLLLADCWYQEGELQSSDPATAVPLLRDPVIWADVAASYEPYLKSHPHAVIRRSEYLRDAYFAQQWDVVRTQLNLLGGPGKFSSWGISPTLYQQCLQELNHLPATQSVVR